MGHLFTTKTELLQDEARFMVRDMGDEPERCGIATPPTSPTALTKNDLNVIRTLPLFAGVDVDVLNEISKHARLVNFNKGKNFLMQGEDLTRLYIILEGWAKIVRNTPEGQELVLHILERGEAVMETSIVGNVKCPANAQAASKIKLLSIPAFLLRDYLSKNRAIATNMLLTAAVQSQNLISHMEQLMLRDAAQRVGWLLLHRHLSSERKSAKISLPFNKALSASYLGIKPETFSRILHLFRGKGFVISHRSVEMPTPNALCKFCTTELAQKCARAGTSACPNPGFAKDRVTDAPIAFRARS